MHRSLHTIPTLPVLFLMLLNHYPVSPVPRAGELPSSGPSCRRGGDPPLFNAQHAGTARPGLGPRRRLLGRGHLLSIVGQPGRHSPRWGAQVASAAPNISAVSEEAVLAIQSRCSMRYARGPSGRGIAAMPKGVNLDTPRRSPVMRRRSDAERADPRHAAEQPDGMTNRPQERAEGAAVHDRDAAWKRDGTKILLHSSPAEYTEDHATAAAAVTAPQPGDRSSTPNRRAEKSSSLERTGHPPRATTIREKATTSRHCRLLAPRLGIVIITRNNGRSSCRYGSKRTARSPWSRRRSCRALPSRRWSTTAATASPRRSTCTKPRRLRRASHRHARSL